MGSAIIEPSCWDVNYVVECEIRFSQPVPASLERGRATSIRIKSTAEIQETSIMSHLFIGATQLSKCFLFDVFYVSFPECSIKYLPVHIRNNNSERWHDG